MNILKNVTFVKSVYSLEQLPNIDIKEICIVGRSNVGKSSLINALTNNYNMAKTSKTAGCTRSLNYFLVDNKYHLVDLPGYGFAKANKREISGWNHLIINYLKGSKNLVRVFLLIDSRHWLKNNDIEVMKLMDELGLNYQIVLTKTDKINNEENAALLEAFKASSKIFTALHPIMLSSSSSKRLGITEIIDTMHDVAARKTL